MLPGASCWMPCPKIIATTAVRPSHHKMLIQRKRTMGHRVWGKLGQQIGQCQVGQKSKESSQQRWDFFPFHHPVLRLLPTPFPSKHHITFYIKVALQPLERPVVIGRTELFVHSSGDTFFLNPRQIQWIYCTVLQSELLRVLLNWRAIRPLMDPWHRWAHAAVTFWAVQTVVACGPAGPFGGGGCRACCQAWNGAGAGAGAGTEAGRHWPDGSGGHGQPADRTWLGRGVRVGGIQALQPEGSAPRGHGHALGRGAVPVRALVWRLARRQPARAPPPLPLHNLC